jgi:hypothetical protein
MTASSFTRRMATIGTLAAASGAAAIIASSGASAQAPASRPAFSFKELNKGARYHEVDVAPTSHGKRAVVTPGDQLVTSSPLVSTAGAPIGKIYGHCTALTTAPLFSGRYLCDGVITLHDGTLTLQFLLATLTAKTGAFVITGGTGAYANATGTMSGTTTKTGYDHTITFAS